jgi:hypothetical protein
MNEGRGIRKRDFAASYIRAKVQAMMKSQAGNESGGYDDCFTLGHGFRLFQ